MPQPEDHSTSENWIAAVLFAVAAVFAFATVPARGPVAIVAGVYGLGLAAGVWLVRPAKGRRAAHRVLMLPLLLQAAIFAAYGWSTASALLAGSAPGPKLAPLGQVALGAFLVGWAPCLVLGQVARRTMILLAVEAIAPAVAVLVFLLMWLQGRFQKIRRIRPKATRKGSRELYLVCEGLRGAQG